MIITYGTRDEETSKRFINRRARACWNVKHVCFPESKSLFGLSLTKADIISPLEYMPCSRKNIGKSTSGAFHRMRNLWIDTSDTVTHKVGCVFPKNHLNSWKKWLTECFQALGQLFIEKNIKISFLWGTWYMIRTSWRFHCSRVKNLRASRHSIDSTLIQ